VAIDRHLVRIVVIDVLFYFNLAAILEQIYFHFRLLQLIEKASFDQIGVVLQTFAALLLFKYY
jgi:hypothetical protein